MTKFRNDSLRSHVNDHKVVNDITERGIVLIQSLMNQSRRTAKTVLVEGSRVSQKSCYQANKL